MLKLYFKEENERHSVHLAQDTCIFFKTLNYFVISPVDHGIVSSASLILPLRDILMKVKYFLHYAAPRSLSSIIFIIQHVASYYGHKTPIATNFSMYIWPIKNIVEWNCKVVMNEMYLMDGTCT